jgi:hypothetical protein
MHNLTRFSSTCQDELVATRERIQSCHDSRWVKDPKSHFLSSVMGAHKSKQSTAGVSYGITPPPRCKEITTPTDSLLICTVSARSESPGLIWTGALAPSQVFIMCLVRSWLA